MPEDKDVKKAGFEELFELFNNPRAILKPGQKISNEDAGLMEKGGFGAFFNPGVSFQDAMNGVFSKRTIIVEDDDSLRESIRSYFQKSALTTFCAQDYKTALRLIYPRFQDASPFRYAIIDDRFPERRGEEVKSLGDRVVDELVKKHPDVRIFGYVEDGSVADASRYVAVLRKDRVPLDELYGIVIADAETCRACAKDVSPDEAKAASDVSARCVDR